MKKLIPRVCRYVCACIIFSLSFLDPTYSSAQQIWEPEGLCAVGNISASLWAFPPPANSPLGSETQVSGGGVKILTTGKPGVRRWHTSYQCPVSSGAQTFLFVSNGFSNKWGGATVAFNNLQDSYYGGSDNTMTVANGKWYTFNWKDVGYTDTKAVWMETNNAPVTVSSTSQNPIAASVTPSDPVDVTVNTSASPGENVYLRWTINNYSTSTLVLLSMAGSTGMTTIPAQLDGTTVQYYAFTSTASAAQIGTNYDMFTIELSPNVTYNSTALPPVDVTFQIDMASQGLDPSGVHLVGSFNGNSYTATPLTLVSGTVYEATVSLLQGATVQYKYSYSNAAWGSETVPGACDNGGGFREYVVGNSNATVPIHCFNSCTACASPVPVTFRVNMTGLTVSGNGVHIAGEFGAVHDVWNPGGIELDDMGGGMYAKTLLITPGKTVNYKFVNGDNWGFEETIPGGCNVGGNRQISVPNSSYTVPANCFGTCSNCVSVTFNVDMNSVTVGGGGVHVAGNFQSWNPAGTALSPIGGGIYSTTVNVDVNYVGEFKYVNGNSWGSDESVPYLCQALPTNNRGFNAGTSNLVLPTVCFARCIGCSATSVWTGQGNTNFNDGYNWSAGVPPTGCDFSVSIPHKANQPTISGGSFSAGNVSIGKGTKVTMTGGTFNICGNLTGATLGSSFTGAGVVVLTGTSPQTISGFQDISNLRISNPTGTSLAAGSKVRIRSSLKLQTGVFNASAGSLQFMADASNEARFLKTDPGASFTGSIMYQKKMAPIAPSVTGAWYFVTSPVAGSTLGGFAQDGNSFHPVTFDPASIYPGSLYLYDQTTTALDNDMGWVKSNNSGQVLTSGTGVRMWAKQVFMGSGGILEFNGVPNSGVVNLPISFCGGGCSYPSNGAVNGWNFVANPYPCPIDWNAGTGWTKTGIDANAIHIWNANTESYSSYDGAVGVNGGNQHIAAGQAFFVNATGGGSALQLNENAKADVYTSGMRVAVAEPGGLNIAVTSGPKTDNIWLDLSANRLDVAVSKLANPGLSVSLSGMNNGYCIAGKNAVEVNGVVPISIKRNGTQNSIKIEKTGSEPANYSIYLRDDFNGTLTELIQNSTEVNFSASAIDENRFSLIFTESVTNISSSVKNLEMKVWPNPVQDVLMVEKSATSQSYVIYNTVGQKVAEGALQPGEQVISTKDIQTGQYLIKFTQASKTARFVKF